MAETRTISLPVTGAPGPATADGALAATIGARRVAGVVRRAPDAAALARRRFAVTLLKRGLPLLAFAALAVVALWPQLAGIEERVRVSYRKPGVTTPTGAASVVEPRFQGADERGRPFVVSADTAIQEAGSEQVVLARPRGDITLEDGAWVMLQAEKGVFHRDRRQLDLAGDVSVFHDSGYEFQTEAAVVDLRAGSASGSLPVAAQGPAGTLDAVGFTLTDRGDVVVFNGPARMVLVPAERPAP
jgi:lipopolysaccharide export system protein LptC